jgi:hypothetical protein
MTHIDGELMTPHIDGELMTHHDGELMTEPVRGNPDVRRPRFITRARRSVALRTRMKGSNVKITSPKNTDRGSRTHSSVVARMARMPDRRAVCKAPCKVVPQSTFKPILSVNPSRRKSS